MWRYALPIIAAFVATPVTAQGEGQRVHRCVGAQGEIMFSGLPCGPVAAATSAEASLAASTVCPTSNDALRERIAAAIARKDANALAGLLRWHGVGGAAAGARLREIDRLVQRPLLAIDADGDTPDAERPDSANALRVRTGSNDNGGVREHRFGIDVEAGCHWLTW